MTDMCLDKLFKKKEKVNTMLDPSSMRIISFAKNSYGGGNSLPGCLNDTAALIKLGKYVWPVCDIHTYLEYDATVANYKRVVSNAIASLSPGATVCIIADSCFSGTITRGRPITLFNEHPLKDRYLFNPQAPFRFLPRRNRAYIPSDLNWLVMSACQENQTASDAYFDDIKMNMGAFSYGLVNSYDSGMTWFEWFAVVRARLEEFGFEQHPTLDGPLAMRNEIVGSRETLIIHNSSHGSRKYDYSGDEVDFYDEVIVFDKFLTDDDLSILLNKIPLLSN